MLEKLRNMVRINLNLHFFLFFTANIELLVSKVKIPKQKTNNGHFLRKELNGICHSTRRRFRTQSIPRKLQHSFHPLHLPVHAQRSRPRAQHGSLLVLSHRNVRPLSLLLHHRVSAERCDLHGAAHCSAKRGSDNQRAPSNQLIVCTQVLSECGRDEFLHVSAGSRHCCLVSTHAKLSGLFMHASGVHCARADHVLPVAWQWRRKRQFLLCNHFGLHNGPAFYACGYISCAFETRVYQG